MKASRQIAMILWLIFIWIVILIGISFSSAANRAAKCEEMLRDTVVVEPVNIPEVPTPGVRVTELLRRYNVNENIERAILTHAVQNEIPLDIAFSLVAIESGFNPNATSHVGARGLAQVMPATARMIIPEVRTDDLYHIDTNLMIGFRYLRHLHDRYDNWHEALSAYNHGPSNFERYNVETTRYSRYVLGD